MNVFSKHSIPRLQPDTQFLLDRTFEKALSEHVFSGAQLLVAVKDSPVISRTWGHTRAGGDPVTPSTRFDLASLTKPLVTAPLVLTAVARGIVGLDDTLERFFPLISFPRKNARSLSGIFSPTPPDCRHTSLSISNCWNFLPMRDKMHSHP